MYGWVMTALYNEIEPFAADWLENLIAAGRIAPGVVDRRSIEDLAPDYVRQFTQVHLFAGIGVWSAALRGAGWPDDRPVWSISCPCQPFSAAGKGAGFADERHLWPHAFHLVTQCRPDVVVGEQVGDKDGQMWFDLVQADLEAAGFAVGAVIAAAAGFGAPHQRHRNYWCGLADPLRRGAGPVAGDGDGPQGPTDGQHGGTSGPGASVGERLASGGLADPLNAQRRADLAGRDDGGGTDAGRPQAAGHAGAGGGSSGLAVPSHERHERPRPARPVRAGPADGGAGCGLDDAAGARHVGAFGDAESAARDETRLCVLGATGEASGPGPVNGGWAAADWLHCRDGRWRPVEPGTFPLAYALPRSMGAMGAGLSGLAAVAGADKRSLAAAKRFRTGTLRGFGNAIVKEQAQEFCALVLEAAA